MPSPNPWSTPYKIPWHDPAFSRRMLAEHLLQDHDLASRRAAWIDRQVAWLHHSLLAARPAHILDLGCGPGFYSHRLSALGHHCLGIDFGPASIDYAHHHNHHPSRCHFHLADIRHAPFHGPHHLAMILYGEANVFSPPELLAILQRAHASLAPHHATLLLELQTPEAVEQTGRAAPSDEHLPSGLFSGQPHRCQTHNEWLPEPRIALQTFTITEATGATHLYRNTTQAWPPGELNALLHDAGFTPATPHDDWPSNTPNLRLITAHPAPAP